MSGGDWLAEMDSTSQQFLSDYLFFSISMKYCLASRLRSFIQYSYLIFLTPRNPRAKHYPLETSVICRQDSQALFLGFL
jgi:hypothetical protein